MRLVFIFFSITILGSCSKPKEYIKLRISFDCTPTIYFDSLGNVLLSNSYADLDGKGSSSIDLFSAKTIYVKNLKEKDKAAFILDSVEKARYEYLYIEAYIVDALYTGIKRRIDLRKITTDTADITICVKPNVQYISQ